MNVNEWSCIKKKFFECSVWAEMICVRCFFFFFFLLLKNPLNSFNFFKNVNFSGVELSIVSIIQLYGVFFPSVSDIIYQLWAHGDQ